MPKGMKAFVDRLEKQNAALEAENKRLKESVAKSVKDRHEDSCAYCGKQDSELMLCCNECYWEA